MPAVPPAPSSKLENLAVLQHARPVLTRILLDFLHRELDFTGLQMRDVDLRGTLEFCELLGEHARAKVFRSDRQLLFAIAESGFDDQILQVGNLVDHRPERVVGGGVARKYQASLAGVEVVTHRRHDVIGRQHREPSLLELDRVTDLNLPVSKERLFAARDLREIGPDAPVEDVIAEDFQRSWNCPKRQWLVAHSADGIDHERNARDMIEVRMREEDVIDERELGEREVGDPRPGVDEDIVVEEHGRGTQVPASYPATATEDPQLHGLAPIAISRRTLSRRSSRPAAGCGAWLSLPGRIARR